MSKKSARRKKSTKAVKLSIVPDTREQVRQGLLQTVFALGMEEISRILEEDRAKVCGPRYERSPDRAALRMGYARGELMLGGRRVAVQRPRARTRDGQEVALPSWEQFASEDVLEERAVEQMVVGVTTRKYERSLEDVGDELETRGTSKSAVSRRFVEGTEKRLKELLLRSLAGLRLVVLMLDGVVMDDHTVLVALGFDSEGNKHVLGFREGATENAAGCKALLGDLVERGLVVEGAMLVTIDGSKALRRAVLDVLGKAALIQRCQEHKIRNVTDDLPADMQKPIRRAMQDAYRCRDQAQAKKLLVNLHRSLESQHPGAASSLLEGLDETLTVIAMALPESLERTLATTNCIENVMGTARRVTRNVKRWQDGKMVLRWIAAGVLEAERGFRKIRGHKGLPRLIAALREHELREGIATAEEVA